jgi:cell division septation protein DedD
MGAEEEGIEAIQRAQEEALKMMTEREHQEEDLEVSPRLRMPEVVPPIPEYPEAVQLPAPEQEVQEVAEADRETVPVSEPVSLPTELEPPELPSAPGDEVSPPKQAALPEEPEMPPPPPAEKGPPAAEPAPFAYTVHLESFRDSTVAQKRLKQIEGMGLEAFTVEVDLAKKGIFHRIFVGRFADRSQAKALQARLKKNYGLPEGRIMAASKIDR